MKPVAIELFAGKFGWGRGFVAQGYQVIGFDIVHEDYHGDVPEGCELVLQDVLTLHGRQFRSAAAIVASPPCQAYSYRAMPWKRAKALPPPDNSLFDACFRIQREASDAAGRHIPMVVENVKGAQPWVGRAKWHYGSFYLWGDVPALMPISLKHRKVNHHLNGAVPPGTGSTSWFFGNTKHELRDGVKNVDTTGKTWFGVSHGVNYAGQPGNPVNGRKGDGGSWFGDYEQQKAAQDGTEQGGEWWHDPGSMTRRFSSRSRARKAASAAIAHIPFPLAEHIAKCFLPESQS